MKRISLYLLITAVLMIMLTACGRGGKGEGMLTKAIVTISTAGTLAPGTQIGGIDMTLDLPAGVSVEAAPDSANPNVLVIDSGKVSASGAAAGTNSMTMGTYATSTNRAVIHVVNPDGFGTGEFATLTCDFVPGTVVNSWSFIVGTPSVTDLNGAPITGLTAGATVKLR